MNNSSKKILSFRLVCVVLSIILLLSSCGDNKPNKANWAGKPGAGGQRSSKSVPVEVQKPEVGLAASYYVTTATLEPSSDAKIIARASGVVKQLLHEEGDDVKKGEVLLQLDDDDQLLRLKQAKQKLASAKREYKRLTKMKKAGVVAPNEWETTENNYKMAQTDLELAQLALSYTRVTAPIDGRLVKREVDLGTQVSQGELLARIMSIKPLLVRVHIPANRLGKVTIGQKVEIKIDSLEKPLAGTVSLVSPIVDPTTGTIKITLRIEDYPKNVRPGDFAEVQMVTNQHPNALLIPSVSLIEERGQYYLYTVKQGKAHRQSVSVGFVMTDKTEIVSGIDVADRVVSKGQRNLNDEVKVDILDPNAVVSDVDGKTSQSNIGQGARKPADEQTKSRKKGKRRAGRRGQP